MFLLSNSNKLKTISPSDSLSKIKNKSVFYFFLLLSVFFSYEVIKAIKSKKKIVIRPLLNYRLEVKYSKTQSNFGVMLN